MEINEHIDYWLTISNNLLKIASETKLDLSEEQRAFLLEVNSFNLEARYPDFKLDFYKKCTKEFAEEYFSKIKSLHTWFLKKCK